MLTDQIDSKYFKTSIPICQYLLRSIQLLKRNKDGGQGPALIFSSEAVGNQNWLAFDEMERWQTVYGVLYLI